MYRRPLAPSRTRWQARDLEDIVMWIQSVLRSPGYRRSAITSSVIQRYMPAGRHYDINTIRRRLQEIRLDDNTFDYIIATLKMDYQAACANAA